MKDVVEMMALSDQWYVQSNRRASDVPRRRVYKQRDVVTGHGSTDEEIQQKMGMVHGESVVLLQVKEEMESDSSL